MLRTLDLFTGVGGITHALRGLARPVMYCERDAECHDVLRKLMRDGRIPKAPIHDDVARLRAADVPGGAVDMIVAGFPCIGFSNFGLKEGLDQAGSKLFYQIVRLAKDLRPPLLFLENVAAILTNDDITKIVAAIRKLGYSMYWVVMSAYNVGAPQGRARWFCLAVRDGAADSARLPAYSGFRRFSWRSEPKVRMMPPTDVAGMRRRMRMLGNSVVPDCVRAAFLSLWTGCTVPVPKLLGPTPALRLTPPVPHGNGGSNKFAAVTTKSPAVQRIPQPPGLLPRPDVGIVVDPAVYKTDKPVSTAATSGFVDKPTRMAMWNTPRAGLAPSGGLVLTTRGMRDLPTQLRFDRGTPDDQRDGYANPEFVEWLMGFDRGWTAAPAAAPATARTPPAAPAAARTPPTAPATARAPAAPPIARTPPAAPATKAPKARAPGDVTRGRRGTRP